MSAFTNAMFLSGNVAYVLLLSAIGLMTLGVVVWYTRCREKNAQVQPQPVSFYNRRVNALTHRYQLKSKELELLRDFARMERERRKNYYEYLNRNARYF